MLCPYSAIGSRTYKAAGRSFLDNTYFRLGYTDTRVRPLLHHVSGIHGHFSGSNPQVSAVTPNNSHSTMWWQSDMSFIGLHRDALITELFGTILECRRSLVVRYSKDAGCNDNK